MDDVDDCQNASEAHIFIAVIVVEYYVVELISTQWMHCVNSSHHSLMSSLSLIPKVGFPDTVPQKIHMHDLGFQIGCVVCIEICELCTLGILLGHSDFLTFFQGDT